MVRSAAGMFRNPKPPHSKSNMDTLAEALKGDWKASKKTKWIYPELGMDEEEQERELANEGIYTFKVWVAGMMRALRF